MSNWKQWSLAEGFRSLREVIVSAAILLLTASLCPAAEGLPGTPVTPHSSPRPVLTNVIELQELPADQIGLSNQVRLRGVMTFVDPHAGYGFVQDETGGAMVLWTNAPPPIAAGQLVEIEGKTEGNGDTPTIGSPVFHKLGPGKFPEARTASYTNLWAGHLDCRWVQVEGEVRSATMMTDYLVLEIAMGGKHRLRVSICSPTNLVTADWVNLRIRVQGVAHGILNKKGQFIAAELLVPSVAQVRTLTAARSDPYTLPITPLAALGHKGAIRPAERIHIRGVVTLFLPGDTLYLREATNSIEVQTAETDGAKPGDLVDVIGFYKPTDSAVSKATESAVIVEDATFRRVAAGAPPLPRAATFGEIASGRLDAELVTVSGVVIEWRHGTSDQPSAHIILLLGTNHVSFRARLDNASGIREYPVGSRLQVTGVCAIKAPSMRSFQLLLRSADDIVLLERAPWWTPSHALWVLEALVACGAVTLGWVWVLRGANARLERRVAERTDELGRSEERFRKLAACLPVGVVEMDTQGVCTYFNPRATEIAGRFAGGGAASWSWNEAVHPDDRAEVSRSWAEAVKVGSAWPSEFRFLRPDGQITWVSCLVSPRLDQTGEIAGSVVTFADITHRKSKDAELEEAHKQLVLSSRMAGMAEVATSVLHNVGNVLTSINISSSLIMDRVRNSKVANLGKAAALVQEHADDLPAFLAEDPKGRQLPGYLSALSEMLIKDHTDLLEEMGLLNRNIEHINEIVAMQQNQGKVAGLLEQLPAASLVDDALRMNLGPVERNGVQIVREYDQVPPIQVDKHKVLQILVNLIRNAKYACNEGRQTQKRITLRVGLNGNNRVKIDVIDNGIGIARENLTQIFAHGFTTRKDGHGFGLHSGALAAKELGGALRVHSDGPGRGAVFTLELPLQPASLEQNGLQASPAQGK